MSTDPARRFADLRLADLDRFPSVIARATTRVMADLRAIEDPLARAAAAEAARRTAEERAEEALYPRDVGVLVMLLPWTKINHVYEEREESAWRVYAAECDELGIPRRCDPHKIPRGGAGGGSLQAPVTELLSYGDTEDPADNPHVKYLQRLSEIRRDKNRELKGLPRPKDAQTALGGLTRSRLQDIRDRVKAGQVEVDKLPDEYRPANRDLERPDYQQWTAEELWAIRDRVKAYQAVRAAWGAAVDEIRDDIRDPMIRILQAPVERGGLAFSDSRIAREVGIQHVRSWQIRTGF